MVYLDSERYSADYKGDILRYLNKYFTKLSSPTDIMRIFSRLERGQRHLWLAFRTVFNFLETTGFNTDTLAIYRKALPTFQCGIDLQIPEIDQIIAGLRKLKNAKLEYVALYNLLLDSGLRLVESVKVVREIESAEQVNGFYRLTLADFRGSKQAYYAYFTRGTYEQILALNGDQVEALRAIDYYRRITQVTSPKYIRKFAFDKMVELEIPESVANFIEGRVAKRIGARHYMLLRRQADKYLFKIRYLFNQAKKNLKAYRTIITWNY
jgi:intergrase/recombinase